MSSEQSADESSRRISARFPISHAIDAVNLPRPLAARLTRALDRALCVRLNGYASLRASMREAAEIIYFQGETTPVVIERLERMVCEHAAERGWTDRSLVTQQPRSADIASLVGQWVARELAAPEAPKRARSRRAR